MPYIRYGSLKYEQEKQSPAWLEVRSMLASFAREMEQASGRRFVKRCLDVDAPNLFGEDCELYDVLNILLSRLPRLLWMCDRLYDSEMLDEHTVYLTLVWSKLIDDPTISQLASANNNDVGVDTWLGTLMSDISRDPARGAIGSWNPKEQMTTGFGECTSDETALQKLLAVYRRSESKSVFTIFKPENAKIVWHAAATNYGWSNGTVAERVALRERMEASVTSLNSRAVAQ